MCSALAIWLNVSLFTIDQIDLFMQIKRHIEHQSTYHSLDFLFCSFKTASTRLLYSARIYSDACEECRQCQLAFKLNRIERWIHRIWTAKSKIDAEMPSNEAADFEFLFWTVYSIFFRKLVTFKIDKICMKNEWIDKIVNLNFKTWNKIYLPIVFNVIIWSH